MAKTKIAKSNNSLEKKRVSFSSNLELTKEFTKKDVIEAKPSTATPGKSILSKAIKKRSKLLDKTPVKSSLKSAPKVHKSSLTAKKTAPKSVKTLKKKAPSASKAPAPSKSADKAPSSSSTKAPAPTPSTVISKPLVKSLTKGKAAPKAKASTKAPAKAPGHGIVKPVRKAKVKLQVTRNVKEMLLSMDKKQRKAFLLELKSKKRPHFTTAQESKVLWEKIRSSKTSDVDREKAYERLAEIVKGKGNTLIYAHDTSRVLQCLLDQRQYREQLFDEFTPEFLRMMKSKYAIFFFMKLLRTASKDQRQIILNSIKGHCVNLFRNGTSAQVLETIFNDYANAVQRLAIVSEFYGTDFQLFLRETLKPDDTLTKIIARNPTKGKAILDNIKETLEVIADKGQMKYTLAHRLVREFLTNADSQEISSVVTLIHERIPEILHTPDGSYVGMYCVWYGTAKERKVMVKNFKSYVVAACKERYGHRVLLAIFDNVDDTVLVTKHILSEIGDNIADVCSDKYGQKVLHHLAHPRDTDYFLTSIVELLSTGDNNQHTKKPSEIRYPELFAGIVEPLLTYMAANMRELLFNTLTVDLVRHTLQSKTEKDLFERSIPDNLRESCYAAIAEIANDEFIPMNEEQFHLVEDMFTHLTISKIMKSDPNFTVKLSDHFADLPTEQLRSFIGCQKGCFTLVAMYEHGGPKAQAAVKKAVKPAHLAKYRHMGATVLLKKLKEP
ncbi:hypothetical protein L596_001589 [Steinernema carpocapsae]|uniref:PUM-HD domain-containing protein n=1 Tax=Steinernema carpocapsae TaxID=34508 RepID=A0A4U8UM65_STECR|nr:hypothetical protein L596_001589 [Steinernema carpocapsae]